MPLRLGMSLLSQERDQITGTARYVQGLVAELTQHDDAVRVTVAGREHAIRPLTGQLGRFGTAVTVSGGEPRNRASRAAQLALTRVYNPARERSYFGEVDVMHFPLTLPVPKPQVPHVVTLHDLLHHEQPQDFSRLQRIWRSFGYDRAARQAQQVVAVSEHGKRVIVDWLGIPADRVHAIHHGINHDHFSARQDDRDDEFSKTLGLPREYLFFPSSLWPHKNHVRLVQALAAADLPDLSLVLSGATFGALDGLLDVARSNGVADRIAHLGFIPDAALPTVYRRATATVFPSLYEGFGIPPLEAMACGCPVASSFSGSLAEICGDAAVELIPTDVEQMAEAIRRTVSDTSLRAQNRERGLQRALRFSWKRCAEQHTAVYRLAAADA